MKIRGPWWGVVILIGAVLIAVRATIPSGSRPAAGDTNEVPLTKVRPPDNPPAATPLVEKSAEKQIETDWRELLAWLNRDPKPDPEEIRQRLLATRRLWAEMEPLLLAQTISRLLDEGRDATTGMRFKVGLHGFLDDWPTLRVFLLDALVAADPETAAATAKKLLDRTDSPEEYAVALRSLTRDGPGEAGSDELLGRFQFLLGKQEWQTSEGFAESLDLARDLGTGGAAAELLQWNGNPTLKSMALHEFAAEHPAELLEALASARNIDPITRANLMARLDPQDPGQLAALDGYLRDPALTPGDASVFLKAFPLRSATTGPRLYSGAPAPYQMEGIAAGDRAALALVDGWVADPALEGVRPELLALRKRLGEWVEQAK